jgi:hypothetical protein
MPDITMCKNTECPQIYNCWRYGCPPSLYNQSYQVFEPKQDDEEDFICDFFIPYPNYETK